MPPSSSDPYAGLNCLKRLHEPVELRCCSAVGGALSATGSDPEVRCVSFWLTSERPVLSPEKSGLAAADARAMRSAHVFIVLLVVI